MSVHPISSVETYFRECFGRHVPQLPTDAAVLRAFNRVGVAPPRNCRDLFGHDMDIGHPFLAGERIRVEGQIIRLKTGALQVLISTTEIDR